MKPTPTLSFEASWNGPDGVVEALRAIESGKASRAVFVLAEHPNPAISQTPFKVHAIKVVGRAVIDGVLCWRVCGADNTPDGDGSYGLCASWHPQDLATAAARMVYQLAGLAKQHSPTAWIFRQPESFLQDS